jgi:spermidine/putrescine transport system ATP-binding protein
MSDHVAIMNEGRFEQIGRPEELYHAPQTAFVAGFVGDSNQWNGKVTGTSDGVVRVTTDAGLTMLCRPGGGQKPADAQNVTIYVRPEFITAQRLGAGGADSMGTNTLKGRVDSVLFNGANSRVLVRGPSGELIEADAVVTGSPEDLHEGDEVVLGWSEQQTMCFAT